MKKPASLLAVAVALAAVVALAGCASGAASSSASSASSAAASASAASASSASASASSASASAASASASSASASSAAAADKPANGVYAATFKTDSSMFHVNEALDNKGDLTVTDDGMTIHVSLASKKIVNLYAGTAADAEKDQANWLQPTTDSVTYSDGATEEVYGFDIPVPAIGEQFDVALLGEKGTWYDHKVSVSDPVAK